MRKPALGAPPGKGNFPGPACLLGFLETKPWSGGTGEMPPSSCWSLRECGPLPGKEGPCLMRPRHKSPVVLAVGLVLGAFALARL